MAIVPILIATHTLTRSRATGGYYGFSGYPSARLSQRAKLALTAAAVVIYGVVGVLLPLLTLDSNAAARTTPVAGTVISTQHVRVADDCTIKQCLSECGSDTCYVGKWATTVNTATGRTVTVNRDAQAAPASSVVIYHSADGGWHPTASHPAPAWLVWALFTAGALLCVFCVTGITYLVLTS